MYIIVMDVHEVLTPIFGLKSTITAVWKPYGFRQISQESWSWNTKFYFLQQKTRQINKKFKTQANWFRIFLWIIFRIQGASLLGLQKMAQISEGVDRKFAKQALNTLGFSSYRTGGYWFHALMIKSGMLEYTGLAKKNGQKHMEGYGKQDWSTTWNMINICKTKTWLFFQIKKQLRNLNYTLELLSPRPND